MVVPVLLVPSPIDEEGSANASSSVVTDGRPGQTARSISFDSSGVNNERHLSAPFGQKQSNAKRSKSPGAIRIPTTLQSDVQIQLPSKTHPNGEMKKPNSHSSDGQKSPAAGSEDGRGDGKGRVEVEEGMYLKSKLWWIGLVLMAVGEGGNFLSYGFAPASVVAPLGTVVSVMRPFWLRTTLSHPRKSSKPELMSRPSSPTVSSRR